MKYEIVYGDGLENLAHLDIEVDTIKEKLEILKEYLEKYEIVFIKKK